MYFIIFKLIKICLQEGSFMVILKVSESLCGEGLLRTVLDYDDVLFTAVFLSVLAVFLLI